MAPDSVVRKTQIYTPGCPKTGKREALVYWTTAMQKRWLPQEIKIVGLTFCLHGEMMTIVSRRARSNTFKIDNY